VTAETGPTDGRGVRPRALIVTVYGAYARQVGGWLSVAELIRLLGELGVDEPAVRSSISRLKRRGLLDGERRGGAAGYSWSSSAQDVIDEGDRRIFAREQASLADGWILAVFSVPEPERRKRHTLRTQLAWLGFGNAAPGVWIAPAHLADEASHTLRRLGLTDYVTLFKAEYLAFADLAGSVASWWDLDGLQAMYDEFVAGYSPVLDRWKNGRVPGDGEAFADHVRALTAWRRMPYLDPGLPTELLPRDWRGRRAADLFFRLHERLSGPALRHVRAVAAR
jgi:phenylacetic acid degradation operon negative regulatory protein